LDFDLQDAEGGGETGTKEKGEGAFVALSDVEGSPQGGGDGLPAVCRRGALSPTQEKKRKRIPEVTVSLLQLGEDGEKAYELCKKRPIDVSEKIIGAPRPDSVKKKRRRDKNHLTSFFAGGG